MSLLVLTARLVLSAVFLLSGVAKLLDPAGSRTSLRDFGVPAALVPVFVWLLPSAELVCAVLLLVPALALWGAIGAATLLVVFTLGIAVNLLRGRKPACHCFGQLSSEPVGSGTLVRNVALLAVAALIVWQRDIAAASGLGAVTGASSPVVLLALAFVAQTVLGVTALYYVLRQNGRMLLRVEALEVRLGIAAAPEPVNTGLPVGTEAPAIDLVDLAGRRVTLVQLHEKATPVLLLFSEPECGACEALLPDVAQWQQDYADRLQVLLVSRDSVEANLEKLGALAISPILLQKDREVADAYGVVGTPSAVVVTDGRIGSLLAAGADAIRELVKQAIVPSPLKRGERVPSMPLRALDGGSTDLATLTGQPTLLLFWNPGCGYCQQMLDDVKAWEQAPPPGAPQMVIVSAGSPKANREQHFRSPVLLVPKFGVSARFGVPGTPAAVLVDAEGSVASEAGVGAPAVLALMEANARVSATT